MGNPGFPFRNESMSQEWREKTATRHSIVFRGTREHAKSFDLNGRGGGIRTPDPLLPKQMRYQATLRPDSAIVSHPDCSGVMAQPLQKPEQ